MIRLPVEATKIHVVLFHPVYLYLLYHNNVVIIDLILIVTFIYSELVHCHNLIFIISM